MNIVFVLSRLWRYLNIYFLKPFDAVNDTLTSYLVFKKHGLQNNYLEIGTKNGDVKVLGPGAVHDNFIPTVNKMPELNEHGDIIRSEFDFK